VPTNIEYLDSQLHICVHTHENVPNVGIWVIGTSWTFCNNPHQN